MRDVRLLQHLVYDRAGRMPQRAALMHKEQQLDFSQLAEQIDRCAASLCGAGLQAGERVAVYLPKQFETVIGLFGATAAGGVMVPINPLLKPAQVAYILKHCNVSVLITSGQRAKQLAPVLQDCRDLRELVLTSESKADFGQAHFGITQWDDLMQAAGSAPHFRIDTDLAAILYTSGSTGLPKGVMLSHRNMVMAATSSAEFLELVQEDCLLALLPLSFDYGLSQLTTAWCVGASVVLMDYLFPREVPKAVAHFGVTGISAVPPIWNQLAVQEWPEEAVACLRYITTSGGAAQRATLDRLREALPNTGIFQMYGLTEAFRSSYLPPSEIDRRPGSVGKAVPNAELMVLREDGSRCAPHEPGELVHRGSLVAVGYWNDPERTRHRFRPLPGNPGEHSPEVLVWSGDRMRMDEEGYLYFEARQDDMIKTSGYRVSPAEVESSVFASGLVVESVALGVPHPELGQAIVLLFHPLEGQEADEAAIRKLCQLELPNYMVPLHIEAEANLPKNPNGKIDRPLLAERYREIFSS